MDILLPFPPGTFLMKCTASAKFQRKSYDGIRVQGGNRIEILFSDSKRGNSLGIEKKLTIGILQ